MSDKPISAVSGGKVSNQVISMFEADGIVYLSETQFTPGEDPYNGEDGYCQETVITFEIGAIGAVIRELRKIQRAARSGDES